MAGLDPKVTAEMYSLIEQLNREGVTIIMISHDIGAAVHYANKILHVGATMFFGPTEEYRHSAIGSRFLAEEGDERHD